MGPGMCYDDGLTSDQLLRRLAYGRAAPMLGFRARMDDHFFGKLLDGLANSHNVLVKASPHETTCRTVAGKLKAELPEELFSIGVLYDHEIGEWMVFVYNRVHRELRRTHTQYVDHGPKWIDMGEVARVLQVHRGYARRLVCASGLAIRHTGGRNEILMRQRDLPILANRPRRWKRRAA